MSILKVLDGRELDTKGKEEILVQVGNLSRKPSSVIRAIREAHGIPHEKAVKAEGASGRNKQDKKEEAGELPQLIIG